MGLFRLAVIAAIGVSLLPSDTEQQEKLYTRAAEAARWTVTFCERNTDTCAKAGSVWTEFLKKAEFGAKLAYEAMTDTSKPSSVETGTVAAPRKTSSNTLKRTDLEPAWRGNGQSKPAQR